MKLSLEFKVPDEQYDAWCAYNGMHMFHTLREIEQFLREVRKYDADPKKTLGRIDEAIQELYTITGQPLDNV